MAKKGDIDTSSEDLDVPVDDAAPPAAKPQDLELKLNPKTQATLAGLGQADLPSGPLKQPAADGPDMGAYNADRAAYAESKLPHTGATSPTILNNDDYTATQLSNLEGMKGLTQQGADIAGQSSDKDASTYAQSIADQQAMLQQQMLAGKKALDDSEGRINDMKKQVDAAAAEKVDPHHWFNSKSTGGKIAAAIGTFLMGLHSPKLAMEHIHKSIDDDMNAQRENISNHWKAIQEAHGIADTAFNRAAHDQEWRSQYRLGALEVVKGQLAQNAAQSKNPMYQNNAKMAIQQISQQQDTIRHQNWQTRQQALVAQGANRLALEKRLREESSEARKQQVELMNNASAPMSEKDASETVARMHPELVQYGMWGGGGGQMNATTPVTNSEKTQAREQEKDLETRTVKLPDGGVAVARDAAAAKDYTERVSGTANWMQKFNRVKQLQKDWESGKLDAQGASEWETLNADLTNTMNSTFAVTRQAGVGEGERIAEHLLPQPPGWFSRQNPYNTPVLSYLQSQNAGKIKAIDDFMPQRIKQAMGDLTPLKGTQGGGEAAPADYSKFGFKPSAEPPVSGTKPMSIPNNFQGNSIANSPGIPSFSQYQRSQ